MTTPEIEVAPAPTPPAPAPAPGGAATPPVQKVATRPSEEEVLSRFDAEFDAATAKAKAEIKAEGDAKLEGKSEPGTEKKAEVQTDAADTVDATDELAEPTDEPTPDQDGEWEEGIVPPKPEDALPSKERSALKAIKDPEIRRAFARAHYLVKGYEKAGMRLSEIPKYLAAAPTPEILAERVERASQLDAFVEELQTAHPDSIVRVAEVLRQTSPEGWTGIVDAIIDNIPVVRPEKLRPLGMKFGRAFVSQMRAAAEKTGDLVLADHADGLEEYLGLKKKSGAGEGGEEPPLSRDVRRRLEEADELERREKQRASESAQQAFEAFNTAVVQSATTEGVAFIKDWVEENCEAYSNEAKAELFDRLAGSVLEQVQGNAHVAKTLRRLMDDGQGDEAHMKRCRDYLVKTSRSIFVNTAPQVLQKFQKVFGQAAARRAEKVARARTARDIGSAGAPVVATERKLTGKGKHPDDVLKEFDAI